MPQANDKSRVLIVDTDTGIADALGNVLSSQGYHVRTADHAQRALDSFDEWRPRLVITDLAIAPLNGVELCRQIRTASNVPIMVLSGENRERTKVEALDSGADDYLVKPCGTGELLARIRALLRRSASHAGGEVGTVDVGDFRIDFDSRRVHVRAGVVRLTPKEFDLFVCLARRPRRVIPHDALLEAVWGPHAQQRPEYLRVYIGQLRRKLELEPSKPQYLITEPWVGYRLNPDPHRDAGA